MRTYSDKLIALLKNKVEEHSLSRRMLFDVKTKKFYGKTNIVIYGCCSHPR
jgi:hypothetical protein